MCVCVCVCVCVCLCVCNYVGISAVMCAALRDFYSCGLRTSPQLRLGLLAKYCEKWWYKTLCSVCAGDCGGIIPLESDLVINSPLILRLTSQLSEGGSWESNKTLKSEGLFVYHTC
jgi:hypothetical protein